MPNEPLRAGCPTCGGTGHASFLRSGAWLNRACPGSNGPQDVDSAPMCHELDNYSRRRLCHIEYKRPTDVIPQGQAKHFRALLESIRPEWTMVLLLIIDECQKDGRQLVQYGWRTSAAAPSVKFEVVAEDSIDNLAQRIAAWLWPAAEVAA